MAVKRENSRELIGLTFIKNCHQTRQLDLKDYPGMLSLASIAKL